MKLVKTALVGILALITTLAIGTSEALAKAKKVPLLDACLEIDEVFCDGTGSSDVPGFISGFVIFNPTNDGNAVLTVMIKGSVPDEDHSVFMCAGNVGGGGYTDCQNLGVFVTNRNGNGTFHMEWEPAPAWVLSDHAIALNTPAFATVLANCGDNGIPGNAPCTDGDGATENSIQPTGQ